MYKQGGMLLVTLFLLSACQMFLEDIGHEGEPCSTKGTCRGDLVCVNDRCVNIDAADGDDGLADGDSATDDDDDIHPLDGDVPLEDGDDTLVDGDGPTDGDNDPLPDGDDDATSDGEEYPYHIDVPRLVPSPVLDGVVNLGTEYDHAHPVAVETNIEGGAWFYLGYDETNFYVALRFPNLANDGQPDQVTIGLDPDADTPNDHLAFVIDLDPTVFPQDPICKPLGTLATCLDLPLGLPQTQMSITYELENELYQVELAIQRASIGLAAGSSHRMGGFYRVTDNGGQYTMPEGLLDGMAQTYYLLESNHHWQVSYLPLTCQQDGDCPDGRVCRAVPGATDDGLGRCVFASPAQDLAGYRHTGTDLQVVEAMTLELDCGTQDPPSPAGPQSFVVRTVLSPFTPLEDLSGITIEARLENNPDTATATATTDTEGHAVLEGLRPNAWFFLVARREGESSQAEVVPTYNYGLWVDGTTASLHTSTSEPLDIAYHAVSRIRYQSLSLGTIGEMDGPPEGTGLVMGQVFACNSDEPLTLANATLGFADVQPEILSYFSASASLPQVQLSQRATNNNGLFIAVPLPVGPLGRPFALGRVLNTERVFATTRSNGARVHEGAVSVIRLGRYR